MSIHEATFYSIQCDYPGCTHSTQDLGEYSAWMHLSDATAEWQDADNLMVTDADGTERFYCNDHCMWDEDEDERVPLPEGIEGQFILAERHVRMVIARATARALDAHERRITAWARREANLAKDRQTISKWLGFGDTPYTRLGPIAG